MAPKESQYKLFVKIMLAKRHNLIARIILHLIRPGYYSTMSFFSIDHSSDSDSFQPRETFFKSTLHSAATHLSEIAPEPYPTPSHLFQPESDLIDLELDSEEFARETKSVPTQPPVTHHMLLTEMDRGMQQSNNTDFHLITEVSERQPASNEISTDAIELHRMS